MRIRTQLVFAAFVLAVVPLAAIVTYSYHSSVEAVESAYRREADRLTGQMDRRLSAIREELDRRMTFVSALPLPATGSPDASNLATAMGEAASFVDALEFQPIPKPAPAPPAAATQAAVSAPDPAEGERDGEPDPNGNVPPPGAHPVVRVEMQVPAHPVVIELPEAPAIPRYVMSEEQRELIGEISALGLQLNGANLSQDEREDLAGEIRQLQKKLDEVVQADRRKFHAQMEQSRAASRAYRARTRQRQDAVPQPQAQPAPPPGPPVAAAAAAPAPAPAAAVAAPRRPTATDVARAKHSEKKAALILGKKYHVPVRQAGQLVGQLTAQIRPEEIIHRVLGATDDSSEIAFAVDREGNVYTRNAEHKQTLARLGIPRRIRASQPLKDIPGWIVSTSTDPQSGLRFGVARPVGENLYDLRRTAARNFGLGLSLIVFALIGIVPLSNHLTRDVKLVTEGAERIAHGDLMTRLPVKTNNELGQLARAFNRMAEDLSIHQQKLLEQERARKEQELQQRLLAVEYERKTGELEEARRFQLSMLPKKVPQHELYDVGVFIQTATEVGGDYYDFHLNGDVLSVTIGDATGHGAKAGTMVTVVKTLFAAYDGQTAPASFLTTAAETIKRMDLGRMAMALSLARFERNRVTLASAGMPPVLVHRRASGEVHELAQSATPLGTLGTEYGQATLEITSGDTVLFLTDGFPELINDEGQQLGYAATIDAFAAAATAETADEVIAALAAAARRWHGEGPPNDDVTFVVVRVGQVAPA